MSIETHSGTAPSAPHPYRPPAPVPKQMLSLFEGELLSMLPQATYEERVISVRKGRRPIVIVNDPDLIRSVLIDHAEQFPKSDVMVDALEPLLGDGILISNGETWHRQRAMLEPAFAQMRVRAMFPHMQRSLQAFVERIRQAGRPFALEAEISTLALEIICRSIFSDRLSPAIADEVYRAFSAYQRLLPQAGPMVLFGFQKPDGENAEIRAASGALRALIERLVDERRAAPEPGNDILQSILSARYAKDGSAFDIKEIVDQVTVFFLAGHETSASALTWALFILSQQPDAAARVRQEVEQAAPGRPLAYEDVAALPFTRMVFLETLRLYPPGGFLTRRAAERVTLGGETIEPGSLIVIAPWLVHRHRLLWEMPEQFVPERFSQNRERDIRSGSFIPFGLGPRVCPGRVVAMIEGPYLMAEIMRHFDLNVLNAADVMPVGRLTIRPNVEINCLAHALN